jgi:transcriptional regulator with XRE-family HTH domain
VGERLKELRKVLGLSILKFSKECGLAQYTISAAESGKTKLTNRTIITICNKFNANPVWFKEGEGEMFNPPEPNYPRYTPELLLLKIDLLNKNCRDFIEKQVDVLLEMKKAVKGEE